MKRKLLVIILSVISAFSLAFGLAACGSISIGGGNNGGGNNGNSNNSGNQSEGNGGNNTEHGGDQQGDNQQGGSENPGGGDVSVHEHSLTYIQPKDATCTEDGNIEYWYCSGCNKYFGDQNAQNAITFSSTKISATGHTEVEVFGKPETCTENGLTDGTECSVCGAAIIAQQTIPAAHKYSAIFTEDKAATCTEKGSKSRHCSRCDSKIEVTEIPMTEHDYAVTFTEDKAATCTEKGSKSRHCSRCDSTTEVTEIPLTEHTWCEEVNQECFKSEAYCVQKAIYYKTCSACKLISDSLTFEYGDYDSENHINGELRDSIPATCIQKGYFGDIYCTDCNKLVIPGYELDYIDHIIDYVTVIPKTCVKNGLRSYKCINCDYKEFDEIEYCTGHTGRDVCSGCGLDFFAQAVKGYSATNSRINFTEDNTSNFYKRSYSLTLNRGSDTLSWSYNISEQETKEEMRLVRDEYGNVSYQFVSIGTGRWNNRSDSGTSYINGNYDKNVSSFINKCLDKLNSNLLRNTNNTANLYNLGFTDYSKITIDKPYDANRILRDNDGILYSEFGDGYQIIATENYNADTLVVKDEINGKPILKVSYAAFEKCKSLKEITISENVNQIDNGAFIGCDKLETINVVDSNGNFKAEDGVLYDNKLECLIAVPSNKNGLIVLNNNVKRIADYALYGCSKISGITIPDSVTDIGSYAYSGCCSLENITIPDGVTSIGEDAFSNCSSLKSITIPDSVTSIGNSAFEGCPIETIIIPALAINYIPKTDLKTVVITSGTSIGNSAFENCRSLTEITIPDSITSIGDSAFSGCSKLSSIIIPGSMKSIGNSAFSGCSKLSSIIIPGSMKSIGNSAFSGCSSLESIMLPFVGKSKTATSASSSTVFGYIFGSSSYDGSIEIEQYYSDSSSSRVTYYIPATLLSVTITGGNILNGAFYNCSSLTSITIGNGVTSIGNSAFYNCSSLTSITIPDSVTGIGISAFYGCTEIETATIPTLAISSILKTNLKNVLITSGTSIGNSAFKNCSTLTSITIPDSVTSIGEDAFYNCSSLTSIIIPDGVTSIGNRAFCLCSSLEYISVDESNANYKSIDGNLYTYDGKTLIQYAIGKMATNFVIPDGVTGIGAYAFRYCISLTNITIPDSVPSIGDYAFYNCSSLESIAIGNSVTNIGKYSFESCSKLSSIIIPDSVKSIEDSAFRYCRSLTSITIPDSVTSIGSYAFKDCRSITIVTVGANSQLTSIGSSVFSGCRSLKSMTLPFVGGSKTATTASASTLFGYIFGTSSYTGGTSTRQYYDKSSNGVNNSISYYIPDSLKDVTITGGSILYGAFGSCGSLKNLTIGDNVTSLGHSAFSSCTALTEIRYNATACAALDEYNYTFSNIGDKTQGATVIIGTNVTIIPAFLFCPCYPDNASAIPNNITSIVFEDYTACKTIGRYAFAYNRALTNINFGKTDNSAIISIGKKAFYDCSALKSLKISGIVKALGEEAFGHCTSLTSVTIGSGVTSIGSYAFTECYKLTSINISSSVLSIGVRALYGCNSLSSITIPNSVTSIGAYAFCGCSSLTSITIPNSVSRIEGGLFEACRSLISIRISDSITSIGEYAFRGCRSFAGIYYGGTQEQWYDISKESRWDYGAANYFRVYCTDGDLRY